MNSFLWRLAWTASRMLEDDEREVVCGDLLESGASGRAALLGILGLVFRRQAQLLMGWRPLLAFTIGVVPFSLVLGLVSRRVADGSAIDFWLCFNNWTGSLIHNPGARELFAQEMGKVLLQYLTLACWAYSAGYVLKLLARKASQLHVIFFCALLLAEDFMSVPSHSLWMFFLHPGRFFPGNAAVFAVPFYRLILPFIIQAVLVAAPAIWGLRQAVGVSILNPQLRTLLAIAAWASVFLMGLQIWNLVARALGMPAAGPGWAFRWLQIVTYWPILYWVTCGVVQSRRANHGSRLAMQ